MGSKLTHAAHRRRPASSSAAPQRHNSDLGATLLYQLATVDPASMDAARFFAQCRHPRGANDADFAAIPMRWPAAASGVAAMWQRICTRSLE
jgi:hypothetical protein